MIWRRIRRDFCNFEKMEINVNIVLFQGAADGRGGGNLLKVKKAVKK